MSEETSTESTTKNNKWFELCNGVRVDAKRLNRQVIKGAKAVAKTQKANGYDTVDVPTLFSMKDKLDKDGNPVLDAKKNVKQEIDELLYTSIDSITDTSLRNAVTGALNKMLAGKD